MRVPGGAGGMARLLFGLMMWLVPALAWAEDTPTFVNDPTSHCSVGTFYPKPGLVPHWSGACVAGKAEGQGVAEWQLDGVFNNRSEGTYRAGLRDGRVLVTTAEGGRGEAEFRNGRMNGRCVFTQNDGAHFDGQCANDKRNGFGKQTFASGNRYEGDYRNDDLNGRGVYIWTDGQRYEGDFADGQRAGRGRETYSNGARYEGDWVDGDYEGEGTYTFADGQVYEGEWSHDLPNGRGVFHGVTRGLLGSDQHDFAGTWVNGCFAQDPYTAHLFKSSQECGFDDD
jgi:hypothetical protein